MRNHTYFRLLGRRRWCHWPLVGALAHVSREDRHQKMVILGHEVDDDALQTGGHVELWQLLEPAGRQIALDDQCESGRIEDVLVAVQVRFVAALTVGVLHNIHLRDLHVLQFQLHFI